MGFGIWGLCLLAAWSAPGLAVAGPEAEVRGVLEAQVAAWNRGEVRAFLQGYEDSPETLFIGTTITRGYRQVLERYLRAYPDRAHMGTLTFQDLEVHPLGSEHALVVGRFRLARGAAEGGEASGLFSLIFRKTPAGWKIIADHTR